MRKEKRESTCFSVRVEGTLKDEMIKDKFIAAESPEVRRQMVKRMCNKIFIIGGEKRPDSTKKFLKKFPYELYVEWNDEFNDLYEAGLIEMAEEARIKYGLPQKAFINSKNNLSLLS